MNTYTVGLTERAEVDADDIFLRYNRSVPDQGARWQNGFTKALASLASLPNRCPVAREDARFAGIVVRRLLFGKHRILFHVIEPGEGETEGSVRVIRIIHGSRAPEQAEGDDD